MKVFVGEGESQRPAYSPADLRGVGDGQLILLVDDPAPNDYGRWAGAIGSAAMRGAAVLKGVAVDNKR